MIKRIWYGIIGLGLVGYKLGIEILDFSTLGLQVDIWKAIEGFFDDNDIWQDDIEQVDKNVKNSYSNLFTTSHSSELTKLLDVIKPKVSQAMNNDLTSNFHASDIKSPSRNISLQSLGAKQNASYALSTLQAYDWGSCYENDIRFP